MNYQDINAETIDRWVEEGWEWGRPIDHETFLKAKNGQWDVYLTPTKPVPHEWLGELRGKKLLGLSETDSVVHCHEGGQGVMLYVCIFA